MRRRHFLGTSLAGIGTSLLGAPFALADGAAARRVFRILRDGDDIGRHVLQATRRAEHFEIDIDVEIRVRLLGITAYRYELQNREVWDDGVITSIDSTTNDDGTDDFARVRRGDGVLEVDGSRYQGTAPIDSVTTSYYARPFIDRRPWLSTQSGQPLELSVAPEPGEARTFRVTGELETVLIYDEAGEWVGCRFDAGGEPGTYELVESSGSFTALWQTG